MSGNIGILGTGVVAQTIASRLSESDYQVFMGTRDATKTMANTARNQYGGPPFMEWHEQYKKIKLGSFNDAAKFADIIFNCIKGDSVLEGFELIEAAALNNKTIIDLSNPLDFSKGMPPSLIPKRSNTYSLGEGIQAALPRANVVKTLNIVNCEVMINAKKSGGDPTMFIAGNNDQAKAEVAKILRKFGWSDIIDLGDISAARGLEMMLPVWLRILNTTRNRYFGFKVVR